LEEPLPFFRDFRAGGGEVVFLDGEFLLPFHELAGPTNLRIEARLLVFEELHDLLLPRGDLGLPRRDVLYMGDPLGFPPSETFFPPYEGLEALREFLLAGDERVLLREDLLSGGIELLLPVGDRLLALLEFSLACPHRFLSRHARPPLPPPKGTRLSQAAGLLPAP